MGCAFLVVLSTSCAKDCKCTRSEDGKKVSIESSAVEGTKFFDKAGCENGSREYKDNICTADCYKQAGVHPNYPERYLYDNEDAYQKAVEAYYKAYEVWEKAFDDCVKANTKKDVTVKIDCKLQ